jgi:hypothetical protein
MGSLDVLPDEWVGTDVIFEITAEGDETQVRFTHRGLVPFECFASCSGAWGSYINGSLRQLITSGHPEEAVA